MNNKNQSTLAISSWSRPKRVVFLVDPEKGTNDELMQIIRYCIKIWGGRYYAIVPTNGKTIADTWWSLVKMTDPDIIYSFLELDDILVEKINRYIVPYAIHEITDHQREHSSHNLVDSHYVNALGIEEILPYLWVGLVT